jgi:hypothetical protein
VVSEELQDVIDGLLAQACPHWPLPARVTPSAEGADQRRYERIETTRLRLGQALAEQPGLTARLSPEIFRAILLEHSVTDQLITPLITAVGRRIVLEQLINAIGDGPYERRAHASQAAYWVRCWEDPRRRVLLRTAYEEGARSPAEFRGYLERHQEPPRAIDEIDDLWPRFWLVCLTAFVECEDGEARNILQTAFPNDAGCYPAEAAGLLDEARRTASTDPERFRRIHEHSTGYGYTI